MWPRNENISTNIYNLSSWKIQCRIFLVVFGSIFIIVQLQCLLKNLLQNKTNYSVEKITMDKMALPTILFCPEIKKSHQYHHSRNYHFESFLKQFFVLEEDLNLTVWTEKGIYSHLFRGTNFDEEGNPIFVVEELFNPVFGLCYSIIPDKNFMFGVEDILQLTANFNSKIIKSANVYFLSNANQLGILFEDLGKLIPFQGTDHLKGSWKNK